MTPSMLRLVDPLADAETMSLALAPRLESLHGKRVALIDNTKHNADTFLNATRELLKTKYGVSDFAYFRKFSASVPAPSEVIDELARSCDALVHGVAD